MFNRQDVFHIRKDIEGIVGSRVKLETNKGRHKSIVSEGVVSHVYPSIFTIQLFEGIEPSRKLTFSYTDVLTNAVEITVYDS